VTVDRIKRSLKFLSSRGSVTGSKTPTVQVAFFNHSL